MSKITADIDDSNVVYVSEDGHVIAAMSLEAFKWFRSNGLDLHPLEPAAHVLDTVVASDGAGPEDQ